MSKKVLQKSIRLSVENAEKSLSSHSNPQVDALYIVKIVSNPTDDVPEEGIRHSFLILRFMIVLD